MPTTITDIPLPFRHPYGLVVGFDFPPDRPKVVDLVFRNGDRTAETKGSQYKQRTDGVWDIARFVKVEADPTYGDLEKALLDIIDTGSGRYHSARDAHAAAVRIARQALNR